MKTSAWKARTKRDLIVEVWEHLDCESVGRSELEAIIGIVRERFGEGGVGSPASVARLLADEGAELRHAEVLEFDADWRMDDPYEAMFRNVLKFSTFEEAANTIRQLDNLRRQFNRKNDREGLRRVNDVVLKGKVRAELLARNARVDTKKREEKAEIAEWFGVWLRQPEIFDEWLLLRQRSEDFRRRFGGD
jgi:hypothetical protein